MANLKRETLNETDVKELLPCPMCGGVSTLHSINNCKSIYAVCTYCGLMTRGFATLEDAIKRWNTRIRVN